MRRGAPGRLVVVSYVVAHLGAICIGLWVVGDLSDEPNDSPYGGSMLGLRLPAPLYGDGPGTPVTGIIGVVLVVASLVLATAATRRLGRVGAAWLWASVIWSGLVGFVVGAALRSIFALTFTANIGGGLVLFLGSPILASAWVAGVAPLSVALRAGRERLGGPAPRVTAQDQVLAVLLWALAVGMLVAAPFNAFTVVDGIYWTVCSLPECGGDAFVSPIVRGGLGLVAAAVAVTGAVLWHRHTRRRQSASVGATDPGT